MKKSAKKNAPANQLRTPDEHLAHATSLLNRTDLEALWKICCRISWHEALPLAQSARLRTPLLDFEKVRLFGDVILASRSRCHGAALPSSANLRMVLNDCVSLIHDHASYAELGASQCTEDRNLTLQWVMARLANLQLNGQEALRELKDQTGRTIALATLPAWCLGKVPALQLEAVRSILSRLREVLGAPMSSLSRSFLVVVAQQFYGAQRSWTALQHALDWPERANRQVNESQILDALLHPEPALHGSLSFTSADLEQGARGGDLHHSLEEMEAFLALFARTTDELRALGTTAPFKGFGSFARRLSPLERYPIVKLDPVGAEPSYIVPNFRHLVKSFAPVIDYTLMESLGAAWAEARGALHHLYVWKLIEQRLPDLLVIPETAYGKPERRGPDLTLIDKERGRLILIEVKGRQVSLESRLAMSEESLNRNLEDVFKALLKLPKKVDDLYSGLVEYRAHQAAIDRTRGSEPVFIVVMSESAWFMSQPIHELARRAGHLLHGFEHKFCVIDTHIFERVVEISRRDSRPLADLVEWHWERARQRNYVDPDADTFGCADPPPCEFARSFLRSTDGRLVDS